MYTLTQAADKLGLSVVTLRRYIKQGRLVAKKVGKEYQVTEEAIEMLKASTPVDADALIEQALETNKDIRFLHQRSDILRRAEALLRERGDTERADEVGKDALIFGYRLVIQATAEKRGVSNRGRFSPAAVFKDSEDRDVARPDPAWIDSSFVAHAKKRADEVRNPVTKAVYFDLVYEFSRNAEKPVYGKRAAETYLLAADAEPVTEEKYRLPRVQDAILRALELAIALKDDDLLHTVTRYALQKMNLLARENEMHPLHEIIGQLLNNAKKLDPQTIDELARLIEIAADFYFKQARNEHLGRSFIELKKLLPAVKANDEERKKVQRLLFDSYIREGVANASSALALAYFYTEALKIDGGIITDEERSALSRRIEEANLRAEGGMRESSFTFTLKNEDIKQFVDAVLVDDLEVSLIRIALLPGMIPSLERATERAQEYLKEFPLSQMLARSTMQDGRVIAITPGGLELTDSHILARFREEISFYGIFLGFLFEELKNRGLDAGKLIAYLSQRDLFKNDALPALSEAIELYFNGKYFSAVTVLLTQLERLLREANFKLGFTTSKTLDTGLQHVLYLKDLLKNLESMFTPDQSQYFSLILLDKRGLDLRDSSAHGLLNYGNANRGQADLLLHLLLILATFEYKNRNDQPEGN